MKTLYFQVKVVVPTGVELTSWETGILLSKLITKGQALAEESIRTKEKADAEEVRIRDAAVSLKCYVSRPCKKPILP